MSDESTKDNGVDVPQGPPRPMSAGEALEHLHQDIIYITDLVKWNAKLISFVGAVIVILLVIVMAMVI